MIAFLLPLVCLAYLLWIGLNSAENDEESYDSLVRKKLEKMREK